MAVKFLRFIKKIFLKNYLPLNILFVNFLFQKILRIDAGLKHSKNYTTRVVSPKNLFIENESKSVLRSLALSGGCYLQAAEGIYIGEGTIWSFNVCIISQDHDMNDYSKISKKNPIIIGRKCWIGSNVTILPQVHLGDNTIVGANSVVTRSFPEGDVIIAGTPAKPIRVIK